MTIWMLTSTKVDRSEAKILTIAEREPLGGSQSDYKDERVEGRRLS